MQNSQRRPLLNNKLLVDLKLFEDVDRNVTAYGAKGSVDFLFLFFARFDMTEIISVGWTHD
jgi:hypothetical protein